MGWYNRDEYKYSIAVKTADPSALGKSVFEYNKNSKIAGVANEIERFKAREQ